jgi:hypothetical protein
MIVGTQMKAIRWIIAAGCVTAAFAATSPRGHASSGTAEEQAACTGDVLSLCFFEIPNEDRIVACLNRKRDRLSPACRNVIDPPPKSKKRNKR